MLFDLADRLDGPIDVVSLVSQSPCCAAHVIARSPRWTRCAARNGRGYDGVLLVLVFFEEAGRFTAGRCALGQGRRRLPVGETEFARTPPSASPLQTSATSSPRRVAGRFSLGEVVSISLDDIRRGGPQRVTEILADVNGGAFVVNAVEYADRRGRAGSARRAGGRKRCSVPGVCRFRSRLPGSTRNRPASVGIWPGGHPGGHGSCCRRGLHVGLTSRQVAVARERGGIVRSSPCFPPSPTPPGATATSPTPRQASSPAETLRRARCTPVERCFAGPLPGDEPGDRRAGVTALIEVVRGAVPSKPAWVVAKGGITSHDVAVRGLGIRRAIVLGQLLPGLVSVFQPVEAAPEIVGTPYVVFAGNVGDEQTLAYVIDLFRGRS